MKIKGADTVLKIDHNSVGGRSSGAISLLAILVLGLNLFSFSSVVVANDNKIVGSAMGQSDKKTSEKGISRSLKKAVPVRQEQLKTDGGSKYSKPVMNKPAINTGSNLKNPATVNKQLSSKPAKTISVPAIKKHYVPKPSTRFTPGITGLKSQKSGAQSESGKKRMLLPVKPSLSVKPDAKGHKAPPRPGSVLFGDGKHRSKLPATTNSKIPSYTTGKDTGKQADNKAFTIDARRGINSVTGSVHRSNNDTGKSLTTGFVRQPAAGKTAKVSGNQTATKTIAIRAGRLVVQAHQTNRRVRAPQLSVKAYASNKTIRSQALIVKSQPNNIRIRARALIVKSL